MTLLALALALAAAPGCPAAIDEARALAPVELGREAEGIVARLASLGGADPVTALARAAKAVSAAAAHGGPTAEAEARRFRVALARHCALAAAPGAPDAGDADRALLARILARPEYRPRADPYALRRTVLDLWARLLESLGTAEAERYASVVRAVFLAAVAAAATLLLAALRRRRPDRSLRPGAAPPRAAVAGGRDASAAKAARALARGDAREAVREALLAAVASLERAERIPPGRALALTNAEIVAAVSGGPPSPGAGELPRELERLVRLFDRTVYGGHPVALEEARRAVEGASRIAARGGSPP